MTKLLLIFGLFVGPNFIEGDKHWEYFELTESINIKVLRHDLAPIDCGAVSSTAMTIGITVQGDTIRVLDLCNTKNNFNPNETVTVKPASKPDHYSLIADGQTDYSKITKTTYGTIVKK